MPNTADLTIGAADSTSQWHQPMSRIHSQKTSPPALSSLVMGPQPLSVNLKNTGSSFIGKPVPSQYPTDSLMPHDVGLMTTPVLPRHIHLFDEPTMHQTLFR